MGRGLSALIVSLMRQAALRFFRVKKLSSLSLRAIFRPMIPRHGSVPRFVSGLTAGTSTMMDLLIFRTFLLPVVVMRKFRKVATQRI